MAPPADPLPPCETPGDLLSAGETPGDLLCAGEAPASVDPLADGILMAHQKRWIEDRSALKLCEKGRRTGITWATALEASIVAASAASAGGDNIYYIGDVKEKALEFVRVVADFARRVAAAAHAIDEFLFEDRRPDGESKYITAYRVRFASGYAVVGLSSRPANIRGLQGIVVIDEMAFHADPLAVLEAVNALLIWGGRIWIISTHNGQDNPFNRLIEDVRCGVYPYSLHRVTFADAVDNGLYERVCLVRGWTPSAEAKAAWYERIVRSYGANTEARDEELFAVPRRSSGIYMPRAMIRRCAEPGCPVVRRTLPADAYLDDGRLAAAAGWFGDVVKPVLAALPQDRPAVFGVDFGRDGDLSAIWLLQREADRLRWRTALLIELRRHPFDVQEQILFDLAAALALFAGGKLDARGNGQALAEAAEQRFGPALIEGVKATPEWYAAHFPRYRAAYEDSTIIVPDDDDVALDHLSVVLVRGRPAIDDQRRRGADGEPRHGDTAVAGVLAWAAAEGCLSASGEAASRPRPRLEIWGEAALPVAGAFAGRAPLRAAGRQRLWGGR